SRLASRFSGAAFTPITPEAHDACPGLYHAETGATLVQGTSGLPIFVGAMAFAVKAVIDKVARDSVRSLPPCGGGSGRGVGVVGGQSRLAATPTPNPSPQGGGEQTVRVETLSPGDTYLFNDPYDGGTHLNDFRLVRPLMRSGKFSAGMPSVGHWLDIGGTGPGTYNPKATESSQEGVRIPPVKLVRGGVLQQDIVDVLAANSRVPQSNWGDLNG